MGNIDSRTRIDMHVRFKMAPIRIRLLLLNTPGPAWSDFFNSLLG
jgi:hypothetical protein